MTELGEPQDERAIAHARIGMLVHDLRETLDDLIRLRLDPTGAVLVAGEEEALGAIKTSLDFLLSEIAAGRKLRIVKNG